MRMRFHRSGAKGLIWSSPEDIVTELLFSVNAFLFSRKKQEPSEELPYCGGSIVSLGLILWRTGFMGFSELLEFKGKMQYILASSAVLRR